MVQIASHRGGALLWPENSRLAFENTASLSVEQVEFDVHPSADGRLVVIHDATLDRTTDGFGPVHTRPWDELARLTLNGTGGAHMLLLEEVLEIFRDTAIDLRLEVKCGPGRRPYPGLPKHVVDCLVQHGMSERTVITSFQLETVREAIRAGAAARRVWVLTPDLLADIGVEAACGLARDNAIPMLAVRSSSLDAEIVAVVRGAGLGIGGWSCNDPVTITRMLELRVDVFTTDRPTLAIELREAMVS